MAMYEMFVEVTRKGCVMIPKEFREKHHIEDKALLVDTKEGVLIKSVPDPLIEKGSLRGSLKAGHLGNCSVRPDPGKQRYKSFLKVYMHTTSLL